MPVETKISFSDCSSADTLRKLSDDLSRKHLSDLIETEEDEVSSSLPEKPRPHRKASTSSTYSGTSMDVLWDKHPRRLSEAGLRRSSDHSVILTEDTDSFIIGERVWVGGNKPGQIAYIGETQFAPGEWAGIVLDEPIGKNDGSVAGVRYFQCPEKRGVFSRLTRLTRVPLITHAPHDASPVSDAGSVFERPPSGAARPRRTLSPNGSIRSMVSSKMNASISTTTNGEVRMGDRVIVSSSRGSKAGTLRYVGPTDFAPGIWAGVELDDPLGKNDGSVDGKRYFDCANRFGLFAPVSKVSRSPSNRKPGVCAIHNNGRVTPLRRSNSRESLTSLGTSIASSRAGELLREKQQHLERLMRERELERAEIAKISLQADRAENALTQLKKEATQANKENGKLKIELDKLNKMLEDERQKVEDLMFRNEEENINKEDYSKYKEAMEVEKIAREQRIRELEAEIALQAARADTTASALRAIEEQHIAEAAVAAEQHREELTAAHTLSSELQKLLDEAYALLKEKESEKDSIGKSMSEELTRVKAESEKVLNETKTKLAIAQTEFETQVAVLTAKLQLAETKLENEKQTLENSNKENSQIIIDLNTKLTQLQAAVDDKTLELNKVMAVNKEHEVNLNKDITKLKMELSAKVLDLEQLEDTRKKQETVCKNLQDEIIRVKEEYTTKVNEYESLLNEVTQQNEQNKSEVMELQQSLSVKVKDYERLLSESTMSSDSTEKLITEYKQTIHERDKEIIKLKDDFEETTANFNIKHSKIAEEHRKEIEERNIKIEQLIKEIESHKQTLDQNKLEFDLLNSQFIINADELKSMKEENEKLKKVVNDLTQTNNELKTKISAMELEIGILKRQHDAVVEKCNELQKGKEKVEEEYLNLSGQTTDSNEQFNMLSQHLKETEKELQEFRDKHRDTINTYATTEQELKQKLFKLQEESSTENSQLVRSMNEYLEQIKEDEKKIKDLETNISVTNNVLKDAQLAYDQLIDQNTNLKKEIESLKLKEHDLMSEFDLNYKKMEIDIERYKEEISILKADGATSEVKLMEKVDQLTETQNDLNYKLEEARKHEESLQKILDDMTAQLNTTKLQHEKEIAQIQTQLSSAYDNGSKYKEEESKLKELVVEKQNAIKEMTLKLEMLDVDLKSNAELVLEKDRQITQLNEELGRVTDSKKHLEDILNNAQLEIASVKQKYDSLIANTSAEGSLLEEQLTQMDSLRKEYTILSQDKEIIERKYNVTVEDFNKLKDEHEDIKIKLNENIHLNGELKKILDEKENLIKSESEAYKTELNKLKVLEEEVTQLKQDILNKNTVLQENELHLHNLNESLLSGSNDMQQKLSQSNAKYDDLNDKYKNEVESLNVTIKSLQNQMTDRENELEQLVESKEKVIELQQLLDKSDRDVKQLTNINEAQKLNYEDLNRQLQAQFDEYKKQSKQSKHELKAKLNNYEKELQESKEKVKVETEKQSEMQQKLTEAQKKIIELSQKLDLVTVQQSSDTEKDNRLEKLSNELQIAKQSLTESLSSSEILVNHLKSDIECKLKELKQKGELISRLQEEVKSLIAKAEIAEREKVIMKKELTNNKSIRDTNDNAIGVLGEGDTALQKSLEDKEMLDGQVTFLNSVIVDMQRKNEQLMARVQALEGGSVTSEPPLFNGRKARAAAPRLFCDICDVFDAHDTEDCPRQEADADAPAPPTTNNRTSAPPRPYCDICEVFGHSTENCDEEETF